MAPPSVLILIVGHGGHLYLNKLNHYLSGEFGDTNTEALQVEAKGMNS